jgi:hypothetical protein
MLRWNLHVSASIAGSSSSPSLPVGSGNSPSHNLVRLCQQFETSNIGRENSLRTPAVRSCREWSTRLRCCGQYALPRPRFRGGDQPQYGVRVMPRQIARGEHLRIRHACGLSLTFGRFASGELCRGRSDLGSEERAPNTLRLWLRKMPARASVSGLCEPASGEHPAGSHARLQRRNDCPLFVTYKGSEVKLSKAAPPQCRMHGRSAGVNDDTASLLSSPEGRIAPIEDQLRHHQKRK